MAAILSKTNGNLNEMVGTLAIVIATTDHSKTELFLQCSVLNKMAAILSKTNGNLNEMVGTLAIVIASTDHSKTEPL